VRPRDAHLLALGVVTAPAAIFGATTAIESDASGSLLSAIGVVLGIGILLGCVVYALVSSLLVWRLARSARQALLVHAGLVALVGTAVLGPRLVQMLLSAVR
jgi:hypothetical protein